MNAKHIEHLYTAPLPDNQSERWAMVAGLIDHLVTSPGGDAPSIVAKTIADPDNGSFAVNEAMHRVGQLINGIKSHPAMPAAIPDLFKGKAEALIESPAYHTLVLLHAATKPRAGHDHYASVIMQVTGPDANPLWAQVPETLPGMWEDTKVELSKNVLSVGRVSTLPTMPDLKAPQPSLAYAGGGASRTGTPVH